MAVKAQFFVKQKYYWQVELALLNYAQFNVHWHINLVEIYFLGILNLKSEPNVDNILQIVWLNWIEFWDF